MVSENETLPLKYVCQLQKSLYGLKISPREWYEKFKSEVIKLAFYPYLFQACMFVWRKESSFVIIGLYVNDLLIIGNNVNKINNLKFKLNEVFKMVDLKEPKVFLGIEIIKNPDPNFIFLHQNDFVEKLFKKFDLNNCNPCITTKRY